MTATLALPSRMATKPVCVEVLRPVRRQVVVDPVRVHYSFLNEKVKIRATPWLALCQGQLVGRTTVYRATILYIMIDVKWRSSADCPERLWPGGTS